jgi:hypothetical protein
MQIQLQLQKYYYNYINIPLPDCIIYQKINEVHWNSAQVQVSTRAYEITCLHLDIWQLIGLVQIKLGHEQA